MSPRTFSLSRFLVSCSGTLTAVRFGARAWISIDEIEEAAARAWVVQIDACKMMEAGLSRVREQAQIYTFGVQLDRQCAEVDLIDFYENS